MTIRNTIAAGALALCAPTLAAQDYKLPESAAWFLPSGPNEFVRQVVEEERDAVHLFDAGCPSGGGWVEAALSLLGKAAETEPRAQNAMVSLWYWELWFTREKELGRDTSGPRCPADFPRARAETWLAAELRRVWEGGVFADLNTSHPAKPVRTMLVEAMTWSTAPEAYAVLRDIARDPGTYSESGYSNDGWEYDFRRDAANAMVAHRTGSGESRADALQAVLLELADAPENRFEYRALSLVREVLDEHGFDGFKREYNEKLRAAGRDPIR